MLTLMQNYPFIQLFGCNGGTQLSSKESLWCEGILTSLIRKIASMDTIRETVMHPDLNSPLEAIAVSIVATCRGPYANDCMSVRLRVLEW